MPSDLEQACTVSPLALCPLQHLTEQLELDLSPLEYMLKCYPDIKEKEEMRKIIGRYGLTGKQQVKAQNHHPQLHYIH